MPGAPETECFPSNRPESHYLSIGWSAGPSFDGFRCDWLVAILGGRERTGYATLPDDGKGWRAMARRVSAVLVLALIVAGAYSVAPFLAMWQIREALRAGDVTTLERKVDWLSVRRSLKQSNGEIRAAIAEYSQASGIPKPGVWDRIKTAAAPFFADPLIDRYVTAEGAPQIYGWRETWRQKVRPAVGMGEPPTVLASTPLAGTGMDRAVSVARRVTRAAFVTPTRVEVEIRDRYKEDRRWKAVLALNGWSWQLTEVHILHVPPVRSALTR